ncbi:MarR family transcriptional regulator, partial [Peribacillus sp. SIMBA_075]|uniref:MarR family winged helix-turn-helix transcriptional regulator n=1 Tax=Peribacillus sp. SIMBA_075 TaxID=3085813 RepID=UPI00397AD611
MTNIAGKLVKMGLAIRRSNEQDRRQVLLEITEEGVKVLTEAQALGQKQHMELFEVLDTDEVTQYLAINEKILNNLKAKRTNREKE